MDDDIVDVDGALDTTTDRRDGEIHEALSIATDDVRPRDILGEYVRTRSKDDIENLFTRDHRVHQWALSDGLKRSSWIVDLSIGVTVSSIDKDGPVDLRQTLWLRLWSQNENSSVRLMAMTVHFEGGKISMTRFMKRANGLF